MIRCMRHSHTLARVYKFQLKHRRNNPHLHFNCYGRIFIEISNTPYKKLFFFSDSHRRKHSTRVFPGLHGTDPLYGTRRLHHGYIDFLHLAHNIKHNTRIENNKINTCSIHPHMWTIIFLIDSSVYIVFIQHNLTSYCIIFIS
jgi:hypothetical protein